MDEPLIDESGVPSTLPGAIDADREPPQAQARGHAVAAVELLDREGQVRQTIAVDAWPLRIGRALDNDVVLSDPHVAASHLAIAPQGEGLVAIDVGATRNGAQLGRKRLRGGEREVVAPGAEPMELCVGRTRLRLRVAGQPLAPELPLAAAAPLLQRLRPIVLAALALLAAMLFNTWLDTDPDALPRAAGSMLLASVVGAMIWCGAWALLSKTFTRQAHFGWHLRVFLFASLGLLAVGALASLLAFSLSWPWLSDFAFVGVIAVAAAGLYFHMLAVEPARHRLLRALAIAGAAAGIGLTLWFNLQRSDQWGEELYMSHLFPPALRLARPTSVERFVAGMDALKPVLDRKAKAPGDGDDAGPGADEE